MEKIVILGASLKSGNRGVNALTRGTINAVIDQYQVDNIRILSYTVKQVIEHIYIVNNRSMVIQEMPFDVKYMLLHIFKFLKSDSEVLKIIKEADLILDLSEGDSFSDIYGIKRFIIHAVPKILCLKFKRKLILMPQTIGPFNNPIVKCIAKKILSKSNNNFVRDKFSYDFICNKMELPQNKTFFVPDMAFYMNPSNNISLEQIIKLDKFKVKIGLNVSALLYHGGYNKNNMFKLKCNYEEMINYIIEKLMSDDHNSIVLVPHVITDECEIEDDLRTCKSIYEQYKSIYPNRIFYINKPYAEHELKKIISGCDFFIGSRMHSCIAAASTSVPTVPVAYSRKFIGVWQAMGLEECVADPRYHSKEKIYEIINKSFENRSEIKNILIKETFKYKKRILDMFNIIEGSQQLE